MLMTLLSFIVTIGIIVTIHEFGHFLAARLTGMRVKRFSIGFPPRIYSRKIGETEFSISWIPLGGYVQIAGMVDETMDDEGITGAPDEFMSKNALQKSFVLSAGVLMNYITAFLIIAGLTIAVGIGEVNGTRVGEAIKEMPALAAGVQAGDQIVEVNGTPTPGWEQVVKAIGLAGDTVSLSLLRGDTQRVEVTMPTQSMGEGEAKRRVIGIAPEMTYRSATPLDAISRGWNFCAGTTVGIVKFLGDLFTGEGKVSQLAGPLGVARLSGESARQGSGAFMFFIAYISVSIAFLNILPFPALDGGHIVWVIIESIIRRPVPTTIKLWAQQIGMAALILLVIFVSYHDVVRMIAE